MITKVNRLSKVPGLLILIFLLALFLRVYKLDLYPVGFHADEARVAWNSLSILKTGLDDHGNRLALYYDNFGDYRVTGIFYLIIPALLAFGNTEFAVRFPSALFGALTVFPLYLFVVEILKQKRLALITVFLLAISSWHIEVSRATSEVVISVFFTLLSLYFLIKLIRKGEWKFAVLACSLITVGYFLYHSVRFLSPLLFLIIIGFYKDQFKVSKSKKLIIFCLIFVFSLTIFFGSTPEAKKRFDQVSIFKDGDILYEIDRIKSETENLKLKPSFLDSENMIFLRGFLLEYPKYFSGDFLIGYGARPYRYATPGAGLLTYVELILFIIGLTQVINRKQSLLPLLLLLIAPLPSTLTTEDSPNLHRAFLMVPFMMIIESYGLNFLLQIKKYSQQIKFMSFGLLIFNFTFFIHMYFTHASFHKPYLKEFSLDGSSYRNVGTNELAIQLNKLQASYEKIVISNYTDDIYPWYAFLNNKDPNEFNKYAKFQKDGRDWTYQNIIFAHTECPSTTFFDSEPESKILVVDAGKPRCAYDSKIKDGLRVKVKDKIYRPSGSEAYVFLERN